MYTTIEPRLIALLNTDIAFEPYATATSPSLDLPPLHDPNILKASGRPLLLEPDATKCVEKAPTNSQRTPQHPTLISSHDEDGSMIHESKRRVIDRTLGNTSPQSLRKILGDANGDSPVSTSKKRTIVESGKDDFVQLPQPPKKQKAVAQVVPPIIIGLFEPPPQAALFPPIASSSFHDSHGRNSLNTVPAKVKEPDTSKFDEVTGPTEKRKRAALKDNPKRILKARKKWVEEETNNLLLGVSKYGVGNWSDILGDPTFSFNERSAVDLKDRFRTCCPTELRAKGSKSIKHTQREDQGINEIRNTGKSKSSLTAQNILFDEEGDYNTISGDGSISSSRKSRAHRKNLDDLAQLGIERPFLKSRRRERKPFSEQDDHEILMGYEIYGPAWTRIVKDPRFHLQSRTPTDLRDRVRNKFPDKFRFEGRRDRAQENLKSESRDREIPASNQPTSTIQPSSSREGLRIAQIISPDSKVEKLTSKNLPPYSPMPNENFGVYTEQLVESTDALGFPQSFDWGNGSMTVPFSSNIGEMDISRLLLNESWIDSTVKDKQSFTDISSIITSNSDSLPQLPSFLNMLTSDVHINLPSSETSFV